MLNIIQVYQLSGRLTPPFCLFLSGPDLAHEFELVYFLRVGF